ncbi:TolC family protein [Vreelandella andesensis]|uniref:TolC family protein n=1 Tax=Vreelandella andesensis TaxID=447567 RepID=A0A433KRH9_9GAMM|nr:TolC family protein [Halomonas andesensis]RUR32202.1 TolC family protein [Halomonas andesensis]
MKTSPLSRAMKTSPLSRALLVLAIASASTQVNAQDSIVQDQSAEITFVNAPNMALNQQQLIQAIILRNGQALLSQTQQQVAAGNINRERSLLQPELFAEARYTDTERQSTTSDRLSNITSAFGTIDEQNTDVEAGVRVPVATGAELVLSWSGNQREGNLVEAASNGDSNTEAVASLNVSIRQPLLQGIGNRIANARIKEAELQHQRAEYDFHDQLLRVSSSALRAYWRMYLSSQFIEIQQSALDNARNIMQETQNQVNAGRQPRTALLEAEARVIESRAALYNEEQRWRDIQSELKTLLNLSHDAYAMLTFTPIDSPETTPYGASQNFDAYAEDVLSQWPGYHSALLARDIQRLQTNRAVEENRNQLDLVAGYRTSALETRIGDAVSESYATTYPTWYVGVEFSMPLGANLKRSGDIGSAEARQRQAEIELRDIEVSVVNELRTRLHQLEVAHNDLQLAARNQQLYGELYAAERSNYTLGRGRLRDLYEREDDRIEAQQRHAESLALYQLALVAIRLAEGSLFERYGVQINKTLSQG